jgi:hypothetical protein
MQAHGSEAEAPLCLLLQVTDIEPDMKVRAAMNEINAAQRMRCASPSLPLLHSVRKQTEGRAGREHARMEL